MVVYTTKQFGLIMKKIISKAKSPISKSMGPHVRQVVPSAVGYFDPFVFLDHFGPIEKRPESQGVPPHPHAGITTITYLFSGSNRHQDSKGNDQMIYAGDLGMMQAGGGIVHSEGMNEGRTESEQVHGLQLWLSLPAKDKFSEPDFFYYPSADLPKFNHEGAEIKVLIGDLLGKKSPAKTLMPAFLYDIDIKANGKLNLDFNSGDTVGVYAITGEIEIDGESLKAEHIAKLDSNETELQIKAKSDSKFVILGGTPMNEPIMAYASFVMNTKEQILQVIQNYENGKMGLIKE